MATNKPAGAPRQQQPDNQPPKPEATRKATEDNNLTTGHNAPGDGGDENAAPQKQR